MTSTREINKFFQRDQVRLHLEVHYMWNLSDLRREASDDNDTRNLENGYFFFFNIIRYASVSANPAASIPTN
jgi:hypothetical protein